MNAAQNQYTKNIHQQSNIQQNIIVGITSIAHRSKVLFQVSLYKNKLDQLYKELFDESKDKINVLKKVFQIY